MRPGSRRPQPRHRFTATRHCDPLQRGPPDRHRAGDEHLPQRGMLRFGPTATLHRHRGQPDRGERAEPHEPEGKDPPDRARRRNPADNPSSVGRPAPPAIWAIGLRNPYTSRSSREPADVHRRRRAPHLGGDRRRCRRRKLRLAVREAVLDPAYISRCSPTSTRRRTRAARSSAARSTTRRGELPRAYVGRYLFADYCNGWIHTLDAAAAAQSRLRHERRQDHRADARSGHGDLYYSRGRCSRRAATSTESPTSATNCRASTSSRPTSPSRRMDATFAVVPSADSPSATVAA